MKIHFHIADTQEAKEALKSLKDKYGQCSAKKADVIVALGGDGTMLEALHQNYKLNVPVYGMNLGSVGFLLNPYEEKNLLERLQDSHKITLHPLEMKAQKEDGENLEAIAFNEVALFRQRRQTAHISIKVDGIDRLNELICDGVMVATPAGSTAYNLSAHGPILPLDSNILALTPISPFRPRRWRGALLPSESEIYFEIKSFEKRPVSATADFTEVRHVKNVHIIQSQSISVDILFDPDHHLGERILKEQFLN